MESISFTLMRTMRITRVTYFLSIFTSPRCYSKPVKLKEERERGSCREREKSGGAMEKEGARGGKEVIGKRKLRWRFRKKKEGNERERD